MKSVLITGASRGIGQAISRKFEQNQYTLICPTRQELDLSCPNSVEVFLQKHKNTKIDVIINNAGCNETNFIENVTDEEIRDMMQINLVAPIKLMRGLLSNMKKEMYGRIVNIGSIWAVVSKPGRSIYSATKNGIHGITNALALELGQYNILVNTVCPGFVATHMTYQNNTQEQLCEIQKNIPVGRMADPEEVANFVYFLGSEVNTYITGQKITIDGGYTIQ